MHVCLFRTAGQSDETFEDIRPAAADAKWEVVPHTQNPLNLELDASPDLSTTCLMWRRALTVFRHIQEWRLSS